MTEALDDRPFRLYARLAGFLYLFVLAAYDASDAFLVSPRIVPGNFAQSAHNIIASETLYRLGLAGEFIASWLTIPLAAALYFLLRPVGAKLAFVALLFRSTEAVLGSVCAVFSFIAARVYTGTAGAFSPSESAALVQLLARAYGACFQITVIFFSVGSLVFFGLLLKARFIPRVISGFGVFASLLVTLLGFANLIVPSYSAALSPGWLPILLAEMATGLWLLFAGVNIAAWKAKRGFRDEG